MVYFFDDEYYYYLRNHLNDIIAITDESGKILVSYEYDSFGNVIKYKDDSVNNLGIRNPYRYRGYRYDEETDLYYLNSRYYSPKNWKIY